MQKLTSPLLASFLLLAACSKDSKQARPTPEPLPSAATHTETNHAETSTQPPAILVSDDNSVINPRAYSYGYWMNGFRKNPDDHSADQLALETGYFGLLLDLNNLTDARFGPMQGQDYTSGLASDPASIIALPEAELLLQIASEGRVFTATHSLTGPHSDARRLQGTMLWESGRYLQNWEIQNLIFEDEEGNTLSSDASLQVVAWPDSLSLTAEITPKQPFVDGPNFGIIDNGYSIVEKAIELDASSRRDAERFTLEGWVKVPSNPEKTSRGWLISKNGGRDDDGQMGFYFDGRRIQAGMNIGGGARNRHLLSESRSRRFDLDNWHYLALSYDGEMMHFYVDGHLQNSKAIKQERKSGNEPIRLGSSDEQSEEIAYGIFDQIRLWDRALPHSEIKAHSAQPEALASKDGLNYEKTFDTSFDPTPTQYLWKNITTRLKLITTEDSWEARSPAMDQWEIEQTKKLTLTCDLTPDTSIENHAPIIVHTADDQQITSVFNTEFNCQVAEIKKLKRNWETGYTDIRNYDEFILEIDNSSEDARETPFMLYLRSVANITGLMPILCYEDGTPTGIPVQLSKNWHERELGSYLRAYTQLPNLPGKQTYKLRIAYGFYGTLPSASHAQLSLVGYGGNNRWDQLAIGCWGETICFDVDRSCVDVAVTDVRMLMARTGADGRKWAWTTAGWGGDWLYTQDNNGNRHHPAALKTAYLAHGPSLTDVRYDGYYGQQHEIAFEAKVQTLRTDDYARTFQKFSYTFDQQVSAKEAWLFKMGRTGNYAHPKVAYGNAAGLISEIEAPTTLKSNDKLLTNTQFTGEAPWWVSFPGGVQTRDDGKGNGYRALVIRDYKASFGGKVYTRPNFSIPVHQINQDGSANLDFLLKAPEGVENFQPGDRIEMDLEWITLHREADDYYGSNEAYRKHLIENPSSWKTTYREAIGNDLEVDVTGGTLLNQYPIQIQANAELINLEIKGGVGYVPIRFQGLSSANGYTLYQIVDGKSIPLDQSVHGNDFWQTDYDTESNSYSRVYNLPLDGLERSTWQLMKQ
ncbi:LamG domain-containing protein [Coraliomargarita sp. SDUM461004]|uniref:LamG domain-containing protein n=1 Tax=Thalassobacterium sedimentorum TaxID=3041258 RepID=A0ABU1AN03_9BACT|nr:LamG domain-containing protein [Coraliomargarita sp. SDUM461004]MDQ8196124.1 LamG domain-containing protein [Coraliomargarita sp. SDUM461004]